MTPPTGRSNRLSRRAFTLMEMVVVVGVGSALAGVATMLLISMIHASRFDRQGIESIRSTGELAAQFRADVHRATRIDGANAAPRESIDLSQADNLRVVYAKRNGCLLRTLHRADGGETSTEFALPAADVRFLVDEGDRPLVRLVIEPRETRPRSAACPMAIAARLGRDHRFKAPSPEEQP